jgi:MoxR-like ATPase
MVYLFGQLLGLKLNRIQFTNDLLPGDILGTMVYQKEKETFDFKKGPIFGQLILADELNRATPKTQSALLQCMEEQSVTVEGQTFNLEAPFIIVATQNPFYQVGTFQLPESQLDRFFMSLHLDFPQREFEKQILLQKNSRALINEIEPIFKSDQLPQIRALIEEVNVSEPLLDYLLDLIEKGRSDLDEGAYLSPRAGKDLIQGARSYAFLQDRDFVVPDDIQVVAPYVLGHRLGGGKGVVYGQKLIEDLIKKTPLNK